MTLLQTSIGAAIVVGVVALAFVGIFHLVVGPARVRRTDIEVDEWMGDRQ